APGQSTGRFRVVVRSAVGVDERHSLRLEELDDAAGALDEGPFPGGCGGRADVADNSLEVADPVLHRVVDAAAPHHRAVGRPQRSARPRRGTTDELALLDQQRIEALRLGRQGGHDPAHPGTDDDHVDLVSRTQSDHLRVHRTDARLLSQYSVYYSRSSTASGGRTWQSSM